MTQALIQSLIFLINILFSLYITIVMLRFLLQWVKADFYNPICQFLMTMTNPVLVPLRRVIPGFFGLDIAAIVLMFVLQLIALAAIAYISGISLGVFIIIMAIVKILQLVLNVFFFAILIRAIMSWFSPNTYNPVVTLINQLTEPLLAPARRLIKPIGGMDLSPIAVMIVLQVVSFFVGALA